MSSTTRFEPRFDAQEVAPGVWLGSNEAAHCSAAALAERNIRHVLVAGLGLVPVHRELHTLKLRWIDHPSFEIGGELERVALWIAAALASADGGAVLVHCARGISRSAACVVAYLALAHRLSFDAALERVRRARPCAEPNAGFCAELRTWIAQLEGERRAREQDA